MIKDVRNRRKDWDMTGENSFMRVERHLYRVQYRQKDKQWSVYYKALFRTWEGEPFEKRLSNDLAVARKLLREYEQLNDERKPLVLEQERLAAEAKKAEAAKSSTMTVRKFAPIYLALPEMKAKDSADRDKQLSDHIVRLMDDKFLAEISRQDLFDYIDKRRGEMLFRCGEWTAIRSRMGRSKTS